MEQSKYEKLVEAAGFIQKELDANFKKVGKEYVIFDNDKLYLTVINVSIATTFKFEVYFITRSKDNMSGYLRSFKKFDVELDTNEYGVVCLYVTTKTDHIRYDVIESVINTFGEMLRKGRYDKWKGDYGV